MTRKTEDSNPKRFSRRDFFKRAGKQTGGVVAGLAFCRGLYRRPRPIAQTMAVVTWPR